LEAQQRLAAQQGAAALQGQIGNQITNQQAAANQLFGLGAGATNTQNANLISNYGMAQGINSQVAQANANAVNTTQSGLLGGISSLAALFAEGGEVKPLPKVRGYADGGAVSFAGQYLNSSPVESGEFATPGSSVGQSAPLAQTTLPVPKGPEAKDVTKGVEGIAGTVKSFMSKGGRTPFTAAQGKEVPGKAKIHGDNLKNDTVPAMLSPGEIVLPRHVVQGSNAPQRAAAFVQAIQAKQGLKRGKK
jgi:hypothetical protein